MITAPTAPEAHESAPPDPRDHAVALFEGNFNCAESTVTALLTAARRDPAEAQRLATAFGGGLARRGTVCGALTGAAMALSSLLGRTDAADTDGKERAYAVVAELLRRVETSTGAIECRTLTGLDFNDPTSHEAFKASVKARVCVPMLRLVVGTALELVAAARTPATARS